MWGELASDQTSTGWELKSNKQKESGSNQRSLRDGRDEAKGVPLSDTEVVVMP